MCERSGQVRAQLEFDGAGMLQAGRFKGPSTYLCLAEEQPACSLTTLLSWCAFGEFELNLASCATGRILTEFLFCIMEN